MSKTVSAKDAHENQLARNLAGTQCNSGLTEDLERHMHAYTEGIIKESGYDVASPTTVVCVKGMNTSLTVYDMRAIHVTLFELGIKRPTGSTLDWEVVHGWIEKQRSIQQCIIKIVNARERSIAIEKAAMKTEMEADMAEMEADMDKMKTDMDTEMDKMKTEMAKMKTEMAKLKAENETFVAKDATKRTDELAKKTAKKKKHSAKKDAKIAKKAEKADAKIAME